MRTATYNDIVRDFVSMTDAVNRAFGARPYDYARNGGSNEGNNVQVERTMPLPLDAYATEDAFVLNAYVPGVKAEDLEIVFEGEQLAIRGRVQSAPAEISFLKQELFHGPFERRLTFNVPVNADAIEATFEHGLLTLRVPKAEAIKPKQIKVQVK